MPDAHAATIARKPEYSADRQSSVMRFPANFSVRIENTLVSNRRRFSIAQSVGLVLDVRSLVARLARCACRTSRSDLPAATQSAIN